MSSTVSVRPVPSVARSAADRRARRVLRIADDRAPTSIASANNAFTGSIVISGLRCLVTYVLIPLIGPAVGLSGAVGPLVGLTLSLLSTVAIVVATRRLFAADHRLRWPYVMVGSAIVTFLVVQSIVEIVALES